MNKLLLLLVIACSALTSISQSTNYDITSSFPIFEKDGPGNSYYYRDTGITVTTAGSYVFELDGAGPFDTWLILYDTNGFNSPYPLINKIAENDDDPLGVLGLGSRITIDLEPGLYTLVGTTFDQNAQGSAVLTVSGPAAVSFGPHAANAQLHPFTIANTLPVYTFESLDRYHLDTGIRISTGGLYSFMINTNWGLNSYAAMYNTGGFNPADPVGNLMVTNNDDSIGALGIGSRITVNLAAGDYVLVGTSQNQLDDGFANLSISGPEPVTLIAPFFLSVLPLHLLDFMVVKENDAALISWTASEDGLGGHYLVQRSEDGRNFTSLKTEMAGDQLLIVSYQVFDNNPPAGDIFYRLVLVNVDGSKTFSRIIRFTSSKRLFVETSVYPNPSKGAFHLLMKNITGTDQDLSINLVDMAGRIIVSETKKLHQQLDLVYACKPGSYIIKVTTAGYSWSGTVVVQ